MMRSNMNFETILNGVQNLRDQLDTWGLTNQLLLVAGLVSFVLLLWSLRELASWFFKVQALRGEVRDLHVKLDRALELLANQQPPVVVEVPPAAAEVKKVETPFRLDH